LTLGTWAVASTVAGLVLPVSSPGDGSEGARQVDAEQRIIRLPHGTTVTSANRLRIGSHSYEVTALLADQSNALFVDCQCKRLA
jgi:head-tail adaptor